MSKSKGGLLKTFVIGFLCLCLLGIVAVGFMRISDPFDSSGGDSDGSSDVPHRSDVYFTVVCESEEELTEYTYNVSSGTTWGEFVESNSRFALSDDAWPSIGGKLIIPDDDQEGEFIHKDDVISSGVYCAPVGSYEVTVAMDNGSSSVTFGIADIDFTWGDYITFLSDETGNGQNCGLWYEGEIEDNPAVLCGELRMPLYRGDDPVYVQDHVYFADRSYIVKESGEYMCFAMTPMCISEYPTVFFMEDGMDFSDFGGSSGLLYDSFAGFLSGDSDAYYLFPRVRVNDRIVPGQTYVWKEGWVTVKIYFDDRTTATLTTWDGMAWSDLAVMGEELFEDETVVEHSGKTFSFTEGEYACVDGYSYLKRIEPGVSYEDADKISYDSLLIDGATYRVAPETTASNGSEGIESVSFYLQGAPYVVDKGTTWRDVYEGKYDCSEDADVLEISFYSDLVFLGEYSQVIYDSEDNYVNIDDVVKEDSYYCAEPVEITFTYMDVSYTAIDGMTWNDCLVYLADESGSLKYVESDGEYLRYNNSYILLNGERVRAADRVVSDSAYIFE